MSITEIELVKSYVKDYFDNLDERIKEHLEDTDKANNNKS